MFYLRKVGLIEGYSVPFPGLGDHRHLMERGRDIAEVVTALDESHTRVMVVALDGITVWISKNCLAREYKNKLNTRRDTMDEFILDFARLVETFKVGSETGENVTVGKKEVSARLNEYLNRLRTIHDDIET